MTVSVRTSRSAGHGLDERAQRYLRLLELERLLELRPEDVPRELLRLLPEDRTEGLLLRLLPEDRTDGELRLVLELGRFTVLRLGALRFGALTRELPLGRLFRTEGRPSPERLTVPDLDDLGAGRVTVVRLGVRLTCRSRV